VLWVLLGHHDAAPWGDQAGLRDALWIHGTFVVCWVVLIGTALVVRRRPSSGQILEYALVLLYFSHIGWGAHVLGIHTNLFGGLLILTGAIVGWVLFNRRLVTWALVGVLVVTTADTLGQQLGFNAYAPLLARIPFEEGKLAGTWLVTLGAASSVVLLVVLSIVYVVVDRWQDRERKLLATSEQLTRANDLISRYVASQLAEQIKAGHYDLVDRHTRRRLTLFFSDIEGFATVADRVEPEDLSAVLNEYLREMTSIGKQYEATIDKFVGDAIMIFFGAPVATNDRDHALRAVRMAIAMQARMVELRTKWLAHGFEHPFHIRIGINTGHASIGNFGSEERMDYTAIGRQVNLAARLQASSEPDCILLSHSTWVLVKDEIPCEAKGELQVKGFQQPVSVYAVSAAN
jgi:class 3 adenylate cyclase